MRVFILSSTSVWKSWPRYYHKWYIRVHVKYALFLPYLNGTLNLLTFFKSPQISNFTKIYPVGGEFHANRRTWRSQYSLFAISWMRLKSRPHICGDWSFHCLVLATCWTLDFCLTHSTVRELLYWTPTVKICPIVGWGGWLSWKFLFYSCCCIFL